MGDLGPPGANICIFFSDKHNTFLQVNYACGGEEKGIRRSLFKIYST
jgi:hypothetical protein